MVDDSLLIALGCLKLLRDRHRSPTGAALTPRTLIQLQSCQRETQTRSPVPFRGSTRRPDKNGTRKWCLWALSHPFAGPSVFLSHKPSRERFTSTNQSYVSVAHPPLTTVPQRASTKQNQSTDLAQVSQATFTRAALDGAWIGQQHRSYQSAWKPGLHSGRHWLRPSPLILFPMLAHEN